MSKLLKKPNAVKPDLVLGKFEKFNLKENPFPATPAVNKSNNDIRYNGKIYEHRIRELEYKKIEDNFLKVPQTDANHIRLGFILDASYVGRGNGKSAFSLELIRRINNEYLLDISQENNKCFGIHIAPEPSGRTKTFYNFIDLLFEAILNQHIIKYCLAVIRLEAIISLKPEFNVDQFTNDDELISQLNDSEWLEGEKLIMSQVASVCFQNIHLSKTSQEFPLRREKRLTYGYRIVTEEDFQNYYFKELKKGKERIDFFFNDLVYLFEASGFNGAYFLIDDFERIPDFQSDRLKRDFALELRTNFFDGISENAKIGFYNLILILHAGVPRLIEKAWSDTGMERRSPLSSENFNARHIVLFNKLNVEHAKLLLQKYLEEYRINKQEDNLLFPFTDKAVSVLSEKAELNAASILEKSFGLLEKAVELDQTIIDEDFVKSYYGQNQVMEEENIKPTNDRSTDLFDKAREI